MPKLPTLSGKKLIDFLQSIGFEIVRTNGSHFRLKHSDGRVTTVPIHGNEDLPKGLLRKIIRDDIQLDLDDFNKLLSEN